MKFPVNWLKDFVEIDQDIQQLAQQFNLHSLEVEEIINPKISNVVVAQIESVIKHPNADKLSVCQMNDGQQIYTVVCGATNVRQGLKTALARVGAKLPSGIEIKQATMRGQVSQGMNCSETELGLTEQSTGIIELADDATLGEDICKYLNLEPILELDILPNRGDVQSILGAAREIAAFTAKPLLMPPLKSLTYGKQKLDITVDSPNCYRYIGVKVDNVQIKPSPAWLQKRLLSAGYRPINNLVDITNYVLMAYGQPLHVFDADKVKKIEVRQAQENENLVTLDNVSIKLTKDDLVITDAEVPIALAGIMGGLDSAVSSTTTSIILEAAFFDPVTIRKTAKRHALRSESSVRFEKNIDYQMVEYAAQKALELILELAGGTISTELVDVVQKKVEPLTINLNLDKMQKILDTEIVDAENILTKLGFAVQQKDAKNWLVTVPTFRVHDVCREIDLIEEVARIYGYEKIPIKLPQQTVTNFTDGKEEQIEQQLTEYLVAAGFYQTATYPMIATKWQTQNSIVIENPLSVDEAILRERLIYSLLQAVQDNLSRQQENIALMEIANQYSLSLTEKKVLAAVIYGTVKTGEYGFQEEIDFYYIKQIIENCLNVAHVSNRNFQPLTDNDLYHPGIAAKIPGLLTFGQLHPLIAQKLELKKPLYLLEIDFNQLLRQSKIKYQELQVTHKFPGSNQDLAFLIDANQSIREVELTIGSLMKRSSIIEKYCLVDIYQGPNIAPGKKSLTYRIYYRHPERTLTEQEIMQEHRQIADQLLKNAKVIFR